MKKMFLGLVTLFTLSFALQAQTVDEILEKYFETSGGVESWTSLKSMKMTGVMSMGQMEFPGTVIAAPPNKQRVEVNLQGKELIQAYDGETAWWINPMMGSTDAQKMPAEMAEQFTQEKFEPEFINYKDKGHTIELEGKETVEGAEAYKLKLTKKEGDVEYHYFDAEYFIPIMTKTAVKSGPMQGQESETYLSDYQEVDGMMLPFFIETKIAGQSIQKITIKSVALNEDLPQDFFSFPAKKRRRCW